MRILLVHSFYRSGSPSGENDVVHNELNLLEDAGYEVALWGPASPREQTPLIKLQTGASALLSTGHDPIRAIESFRPDLIHIHNLFPQIGTRWLKRIQIPQVMTLHNYRLGCAAGVLFRDGKRCTDCLDGTRLSAITHKCYHGSRTATLPVLSHQTHLRHSLRHHIDMTIFTSEFSQRILNRYVPGASSIVLPNYVAPLIATPRRQAEFSGSFFVTVGRLSEEKGVDQLIRAWPRDKQLVVVGDGPQRASLERLAAEAPIQFRGFTSAAERDMLIANASALVLPSVTPEVDPVSVAQALSVGTPCLVRSHTASADLASSCGAIRIYEDPTSLLNGLNAIETDKGLTKEARDFYQSRWSSESWLRGFAEEVVRPLTGKTK